MTKVSSPIEGSSFSPCQIRLLKISIAIMTALLVLGILGLVYGMARQASRLGGPPSQGPATVPYARSLMLGQGQLKQVLSGNGLIALHWKGETGDIIITLDPRSGNEIGRIQVPSAEQASSTK